MTPNTPTHALFKPSSLTCRIQHRRVELSTSLQTFFGKAGAVRLMDLLQLSLHDEDRFCVTLTSPKYKDASNRFDVGGKRTDLKEHR